ncbi:hypothetical protein [Pseudoalteromonas ruthenica]|uniref:hypothetical protein n=1 Tax=Pseudoalteromonas ruthenica TaxID=151081 RepID=UPI00241D3E0E|nr:hypothetical protein [Pseudoalteromonas ruthenica]|tara:strand:+ start:4018 stop:4554 length:537 start_codon:yes stop_codon:yes gene_type:complete
MRGEVDSFYLYCLAGMLLVVVGLTWFMLAAGFEINITHFTYPTSGLSLILFEPVMSGLITSWMISVCLLINGTLNTVKAFWLDNKYINLALNWLKIILVVLLILTITLVSASYLLWPLWASHNGYQPCPSFTLFFTDPVTTAWVTDIEICHNDKVDGVLKNNLHETVLRANELIENLK